MSAQSNGSDFANKLMGYLQKVDYRRADSERERENVFQLRHEAYLQEGMIEPNPTRSLSDDYDDFKNCYIFGIYVGDDLVSSVRIHVITPEFPRGPALDVFPDIVGPLIHDEGFTILDPTRFVASPVLAKKYPELPYFTLRVASMANDYFNADVCLATVRREHMAFYRRTYRAEILSEPRPYPPLQKPIAIMRVNYLKNRDKIIGRYPIFDSTFTERRMLFERPQPVVQDEYPSNISTLAG